MDEPRDEVDAIFFWEGTKHIEELYCKAAKSLLLAAAKLCNRSTDTDAVFVVLALYSTSSGFAMKRRLRLNVSRDI